MKQVIVASLNPIKISAVKDTLRTYDSFKNFQIHAVEIASGVSDQPKSLEETLQGAINRAIGSLTPEYEFSFGIESGLMRVPYTKTGYMDFCACAIYDGKEPHIGLSSAFEFPTKITTLIHEQGLNATQACRVAGLCKSDNIGAEEGIIGIITNGRMTRKDYTMQAVIHALTHLDRPELYTS